MMAIEPGLAATVARLTGRHGAQFYLDIHPIFDENWTGISTVAGALAEVLLRTAPDHTRFFIRHEAVAAEAVRDAVARSSGLYLARDFANGDACDGPLPIARDRIGIGLFPSVKTARGLFDHECSIVHDATTLLTPQYHTLANINHHMASIIQDIGSNSVTACVSQATASDVAMYLPVSPEQLVVAYNGITWPDEQLFAARNAIGGVKVEPYLVILGTREPRKNIALVTSLIETYPDVLDRFRFVFTGKLGWLEEEQQISPVIRRRIEQGRVLFTGYLSNREKAVLLLGAEATIYPSFFEGFGLPILESLAVGTPCLASFTTSMSEVGGDLCRYFDPYSVMDLHAAVLSLQTRRDKGNPEFLRRCQHHVDQFTWDRAADTMLRAIESRLP